MGDTKRINPDEEKRAAMGDVKFPPYPEVRELAHQFHSLRDEAATAPDRRQISITVGYGNDLTFAALRQACSLRLPRFKNARGEPAHSEPDGSDWSLNDWFTATAGELGEAANIAKKIRRGDLTLDEGRSALAGELADVAIYLDHVARKAGIDLGKAIVEKFNFTSLKVGADVFLKTE